MTSTDILGAIADTTDRMELKAIIDANPAAVDQLDENGMPPLYRAALYRNQSAIDALLAANAKLDIFACCYLKQNEAGRQLLERDQSLVNATTQTGRTPLHLAAEKGNSVLAELLVQLGADVDTLDDNDKTPMLDASHGGPWKPAADQQIIELLIENGADVDMHLAAAIGRADRLALELDQSQASPDSLDSQGYSALYHAAHNNHLDCVQLLIERGANVNLICDNETALSSAALHLLSQQCDPEICRTLIAHGAPYDIHTASALGDVEQINRLIAKDNSSMNSQLYDFTPADYAVHCGQLESLRTLLEAGVDPNAVNGMDESLLPKCEHLRPLYDLLVSYGARSTSD